MRTLKGSMSRMRRMALCGVMCALSTVLMSLGGMIPLATYISPSLAGLCLIPIFVECGERPSLSAWLACSALSLLLCPDKEAALLYAFVGYYPVLRWRLDRIRNAAMRILAKLLVFNTAVCAMLAMAAFVLHMDAIVAEYRELGLIMGALCLALGNVTLLLYDRMLVSAAALYVRRIRGKIS